MKSNTMTKFELIQWLNNCPIEWWVDEENSYSVETASGTQKLFLNVCFSVPEEKGD